MSSTTASSARYRLVRSSREVVVAPTLDEHQQAVVDHAGGPLLVLAGPGTGKTTTLVEAIVDRIEVRGADPASVLALTFSRKAAEQLRDRVTARLGRTVASPVASTFHSFAYGLVREFADTELYTAPLRLLSAPEADVALHELLVDPDLQLEWPEGLRVAARTRGFTRELSAVLARARERGVDHEGLVAFGLEHGIGEFVAAGQFMEAYLTHLDDHAATDYPDLMRRAVIEAQTHREQLRARFEHVFVDEYQDTDPGQVALLSAIAGEGRNLIAVGDPHQSIYGFRGADVRGILGFPTTFTTATGDRAPVVVLRDTRRFGRSILDASQAVAARLPLHGGIGVEHQRAFRSLRVDASAPEASVEVLTYDTERAEVEHIADLLRRAHLESEVPWGQMAVLVRSGRTSLPVLRRSLAAAGVPVDIARDETPLSSEPSLVPLISALRVVAHLDVTDSTHPDHVGADEIESLLVSPLVGLDASAVRSLARTLRRADVAAAAVEGRAPVGSRALVAAAVMQPDRLTGFTDEPAIAVRRFGELVARARDHQEASASPEDLLWLFWSSARWGTRLRQAVERGGAGARRAHRDLDAVCALFEMASKVEEQRGHTGIKAFLQQIIAQQIPADTLAETGVRGDAVRLLTAHRSKGLEWDLVVVAHAQQGAWPDVRRRATLLQADRMGGGVYGHLERQEAATARGLLAEERRLFYVAITRARRRLVVTAVRSSADDGEQPSQFLAETGVEPRHIGARPSRPLTLIGLVGRLRIVAADSRESPGMRRAAAQRLARLAEVEAAGRPLVPAADPANWWGTHGWTQSEEPVRTPSDPITLSASTVTSVLGCPAKWFLEHEAGGVVFSNQAAGFGNLVHKLAEHIAGSGLEDVELDDLMRLVDAVWDRIPFRTPWSSLKEREAAREVISRFLAQHRRADARVLKATEQQLNALVRLPDGVQVRLHGYADRLEVTADGEVVVVDLKTGKYPPTEKELAEHPQLGIYQLAVDNGAVDELMGQSSTSGGAELWQLRQGSGLQPKVQRQEPQQRDEEGWLPSERQLSVVEARIRAEDFPATPGKDCTYCAFTNTCPAYATQGVLS